MKTENRSCLTLLNQDYTKITGIKGSKHEVEKAIDTTGYKPVAFY